MNQFKHLYNDEWDKKPVLICCSAGPDSVFLVHFIGSLTKFTNHHLIYLNHNLRDREILDEIETVKALGKTYHLHCHIENVAFNKKNQAAFREARLSKINNICKKHQISTVLLGHHLNDDIETLFMQLLKGATTNFRGIPRETVIDGIEYCHPLLPISKKMILNYLNKHQIKFKIDSSNKTKDYDRNSIRHGINSIIDDISAKEKQAHLPLTMLKSLEDEFHEKAKTLEYTKINNDFWLKKKLINRNKFNPHLILKSWLEWMCGIYVNYNDLKKIENSLSNTKITTIKCQEWLIKVDYKWIVASKLPKKIQYAIKENQCIKTDVGTICCTKLMEIFKSNNERLCIPNELFNKVQISTINECSLKIPSQKKKLREKNISPLEQTISPIFYTDDEILWIPNCYIKQLEGTIVITFHSTK